MHELGLCDAMLRMVRGIIKEEAITEVQRITIEVGTLSGVVPAYMEDCWEAVTDGTELESAEFVVETLQGTAQCMDCDAIFPSDVEHLKCPECGGHKLTPLTGRDLTLKEILVP